MLKMRMFLRSATWLSLVRSAILAAATTYLIQPLSANAATVKVCTSNNPCTTFINKYISPFILLLTALVGVLAVVSIIVAGIQYSMSADDPGAVSKAKNRIFQTVIGLFAYFFLFAFLNFLIPGGLF
jgi:hypothetical protein